MAVLESMCMSVLDSEIMWSLLAFGDVWGGRVGGWMSGREKESKREEGRMEEGRCITGHVKVHLFRHFLQPYPDISATLPDC